MVSTLLSSAVCSVHNATHICRFRKIRCEGNFFSTTIAFPSQCDIILIVVQKRKGGIFLIFGKHINRYYFKYAHMLLLGLAALITVDYMQLLIPNLYQMVINGMNQGFVMVDGVKTDFTMDFLLDKICMPMVGVIIAIVIGRFLWRICFFGAAVRLEADMRNRMFDHAKELSREYYQIGRAHV